MTHPMRIVIILPTFNERANIGRLIDELQVVFRALAHEMHVLVVDDNSPDGTADVVRDRQVTYQHVHLLLGQKLGLGAAYIRGIRFALASIHVDALFEMDADFSHKPQDVPRLIAALELGADVAVGSRYVPGGSIPKLR